MTVLQRIKEVADGTLTVDEVAKIIGTTRFSVTTAAYKHKVRTGHVIKFALGGHIGAARWRKAVQLHNEGLTANEIAAKIGITRKQLLQCICRAKKDHGLSIKLL